MNGSEMIFIMNLRISTARARLSRAVKGTRLSGKASYYIERRIDEFYPRVRQKEPELAHKFVILMIGRYSEEKRQDVLIEAVKRSAHSHRIQLILAGQGPKERSLRWQGRSLRYPPIMGFF